MEYNKCPKCGELVREGVRFCTHCGEDMTNINNSDLKNSNDNIITQTEETISNKKSLIICEKCGCKISDNAKTCPKCGAETKYSFFDKQIEGLLIGLFFISFFHDVYILRELGILMVIICGLLLIINRIKK